jgi:hypothetical protein
VTVAGLPMPLLTVSRPRVEVDPAAAALVARAREGDREAW